MMIGVSLNEEGKDVIIIVLNGREPLKLMAGYQRRDRMPDGREFIIAYVEHPQQAIDEAQANGLITKDTQIINERTDVTINPSDSVNE